MSDIKVLDKMYSKESRFNVNSSVIMQIDKTTSARNKLVKNQVANAVYMIADIKSIPALISLLKDPEFDVRWIAAEGLIKIGRRSIVPLLKSIRDEDNSYIMNRCAHHILLNLTTLRERGAIEQLLFSLYNHTEAGKSAPAEATTALVKTFRCKT
jgi:HEAT repeat protein